MVVIVGIKVKLQRRKITLLSAKTTSLFIKFHEYESKLKAQSQFKNQSLYE